MAAEHAGQRVRLGGFGEIVNMLLFIASWICLTALSMTALAGGVMAWLLGVMSLLLPSLVMAFVVHVPLFGLSAILLVAEAPAARLATTFHLIDARPRPDMVQGVSIGRRGRYERRFSYQYVLAPVLPQAWQAGEPVPAWAIAGGR